MSASIGWCQPWNSFRSSGLRLFADSYSPSRAFLVAYQQTRPLPMVTMPKRLPWPRERRCDAPKAARTNAKERPARLLAEERQTIGVAFLVATPYLICFGLLSPNNGPVLKWRAQPHNPFFPHLPSYLPYAPVTGRRTVLPLAGPFGQRNRPIHVIKILTDYIQ